MVVLRRGSSFRQLDNELQCGVSDDRGGSTLLHGAYHGQHPSHRSISKWPFHQRHPVPYHWLCIERIGPSVHKSRCHMHPVPCAAAKRDLQRFLVLRLLMPRGAAALKYHTLHIRDLSEGLVLRRSGSKLTRVAGMG
jgi:hypothetical protein